MKVLCFRSNTVGRNPWWWWTRDISVFYQPVLPECDQQRWGECSAAPAGRHSATAPGCTGTPARTAGQDTPHTPAAGTTAAAEACGPPNTADQQQWTADH